MLFAVIGLYRNPFIAYCGNMEKLITRRELAQILRVSYESINTLVKNGLPEMRTGPKGKPHAVRYKWSEVEEWLKSNLEGKKNAR